MILLSVLSLTLSIPELDLLQMISRTFLPKELERELLRVPRQHLGSTRLECLSRRASLSPKLVLPPSMSMIPISGSKVMPDFVTPEILINKLAEMEEAFEKPVGGRRSKAESNGEKSLSRGNIKKVKEYMVDLKGVMEDIFEQDQEGTLSAADKESCQRLLLMVSVKEKMFSKDQRNTAKKLLSRLEGDRRRKCRDSEGGRADRRSVGPGDGEIVDSGIRKELLIVSSKKKRTKRGTPRKGEDGKSTPRRDSDIDEDGFKVSKSFSAIFFDST